MTQCNRCGYHTDQNVKFCPACGAEIVIKKIEKPEPKPAAKKLSPSELMLKYADSIDNEKLYMAAARAQNGQGEAKDEKTAREIYTILAYRGYHNGMYKLAEMLLKDGGGNKAAVTWLKIADEGGHIPSGILLKQLEAQGKIAKERGDIPADSALQRLVKEALPDVVKVIALINENCYSSGAGCIIEGGYVVTNAHVVKGGIIIAAEFEDSVDDKTYQLIPLAVDYSTDVAILRFADEQAIFGGGARKPLPLRLDSTEYGEAVYTIGNPLSVGLSVSSGVVSCPQRRAEEWKSGLKTAIQCDITANHGNSGGPLLDMHNNVLGLLTFAPAKSEGGLSMCVPAEYIIKLINKIH